ncbi:MAG: AAA family ATPase [Candidatus Obscuribacterales bacterium]|nr:AAA family ATPase [Candidatus Obscuribacterales bacterium]
MNTPLSAEQFTQLLGDMPDGGLVMLIGLPASGKSNLAQQMAALGFEHLCADLIRLEILGNEADQSQPGKINSIVRQRLESALAHNKRVVLDMANATRKTRRQWIEQARSHGKPIHLVVLDTPLDVCVRRNSQRSRVVPVEVIRGMYNSMLQSGAPGDDEGKLHVLQPGPNAEHYILGDVDEYRRRRPESCKKGRCAPVDTSKDDERLIVRWIDEDVKLDIIGDVHGCYDELLELIDLLGYKLAFKIEEDGSLSGFNLVPPEPDRRLAFVGDFSDRGPASDKVLALVMHLCQANLAIAVRGNHDEKLRRYLKGNPVEVKGSLAATATQVDARGQAFRQRLLAFLSELPIIYETADLIMVHGAYRHGASPAVTRKLCLYGETDGSKDEHGFTRRLHLWEQDYTGDKYIVRGHDVVRKPRFRLTPSGKAIVNVDTGCAFGRRLTALRFPEVKLFSVPARREYSKLFG